MTAALPRKNTWLSARPRVVVLNHFSMQEQHLFSSTLGGPRTGASALQRSRAASPRGSSPTGYTTTRTYFGLTQSSPKQSGKSTTNMSNRQPSLVGNGDTSSTGLPKDKHLDDLSLVRHQCPPNILACRISHFYQNWE